MDLHTWGVSVAVFLPVVGALVLTVLPRRFANNGLPFAIAALVASIWLLRRPRQPLASL